VVAARSALLAGLSDNAKVIQKKRASRKSAGFLPRSLSASRHGGSRSER
jgi:hypothetical protein